MYCTIPVLVVITVYSTDVSTVQYLRNNDIIRVAYQVDTNHFSGIGIISPPSVGIVGIHRLVLLGIHWSVFRLVLPTVFT